MTFLQKQLLHIENLTRIIQKNAAFPSTVHVMKPCNNWALQGVFKCFGDLFNVCKVFWTVVRKETTEEAKELFRHDAGWLQRELDSNPDSSLILFNSSLNFRWVLVLLLWFLADFSWKDPCQHYTGPLKHYRLPEELHGCVFPWHALLRAERQRVFR